MLSKVLLVYSTFVPFIKPLQALPEQVLSVRSGSPAFLLIGSPSIFTSLNTLYRSDIPLISNSG